MTAPEEREGVATTFAMFVRSLEIEDGRTKTVDSPGAREPLMSSLYSKASFSTMIDDRYVSPMFVT